LAGLRWQAIDFDHRLITINHKIIKNNKQLTTSDILKSDSSYRTFPLVDGIREALLEQKERIREDKLFFGKQYNMNWTGYVFVDEKGELLSPDCMTHDFGDLLKKHGLKHIRLHDLRHSCASLLLANGVNLKMIQEWMGHADFSTTANVYSHLDFSNKLESANVLSNALNFTCAPMTVPRPESRSDLGPTGDIKKQIAEDMARLGIKSYIEYAEYLNGQEEAEMDIQEEFEPEHLAPKRKSEMSM